MTNELTPSDPELVAPIIECAFSADEFCVRLKASIEVEPIYAGIGSLLLALIGFVGLIGLQVNMYVQQTHQSNSGVRRQLIARIQQLAEGRSMQY